jgi:hypothetical protein
MSPSGAAILMMAPYPQLALWATDIPLALPTGDRETELNKSSLKTQASRFVGLPRIIARYFLWLNLSTKQLQWRRA